MTHSRLGLREAVSGALEGLESNRHHTSFLMRREINVTTVILVMSSPGLLSVEILKYICLKSTDKEEWTHTFV